MDTLYYSNFCKHCEKIKHYIVKANLLQQVNSICIDRRTVDPNTGQIVVTLDNGKRIPLPPNIHVVPSLLVRSNYHVITGDEIIAHFEPKAAEKEMEATAPFGGEPAAFDIMGATKGDQFTFYADGRGENRVKYVDAEHSNLEPIRAIPDSYRPNKISTDVTVEDIDKQRRDNLPALGIPY
jgi:hypothetical protein